MQVARQKKPENSKSCGARAACATAFWILVLLCLLISLQIAYRNHQKIYEKTCHIIDSVLSIVHFAIFTTAM